jgi:GNAT superfamily N-acetyltransferase
MAVRFDSPAYDLAPDVRLAPATGADAVTLGAAIAAMEPWASYPIAAETLTAFLAEVEPGAPRLAVHAGGVLAGVIAVRTNWLRGPYVQLLALLPAAHGRGLGTRLLAFVEAEARTAGERNLWIAATATNAGALRLYARCGFVATATLPGLVRDGHSEILLRKRLIV